MPKPRTRAQISIHSLVKRETNGTAADYAGVPISIHSLVKRETLAIVACMFSRLISIHSLVKRETQKAKRQPDKRQFQSTPS